MPHLVGQMRQVVAGGGVDHGCVGRQVGGGPRLAVARDRAVDEARVGFAERGEVEAEPAHHARPVVLHQDVDFGGETVRGRDGALLLEVEHHAALAGVELAEVAAGAVAQRRARAHHVTFRRLDLDDVGAEIGQQARAVRPGDGGGEVEDPQAGKCLVHVRPRSWDQTLALRRRPRTARRHRV
jgi:hypothetical protein